MNSKVCSAVAVIGVMFAVVPPSITGQSSTCSRSLAIAAEDAVDRLKTWDDFYRTFQRFSGCDDGSIAEGWNDFVARTLAQQWNRLGDLQRLADKDQRFRTFVLKHIGLSASGADLDKAALNARERCPARARTLCDEIIKAVEGLGQ